jgi:putative ABC transport system permease protein
MVLRNVLRTRLRTVACLFAAAMGASVLVNGFMMQMAREDLIDFQFRRILHSDLDLTFKDERDQSAWAEAARLPGVDRAEPILDVACTFLAGHRRKKGAVRGLLPGATLTVPRDLNGRALRIPAHGLAMSRQLAETLHVGRGDRVGMQPTKGQRRLVYVRVAEISDSYFGTAVYADIHYLSRLIGEELALSGVQLATDRDAAHRAALYRELKQMPALQAVTARADMIRNLEETVLKHQGIVIGLLVSFAGVVFFGSILNTSLVSLAERQREIATLRVLGYGPWEVGSLLLRESMITTTLGTLLGMPLGYLLTVATARAYASDLFRLPIIVSGGLWTLTLALAVVFGLVTHLFVQRAIHTMDWLDALKTQE